MLTANPDIKAFYSQNDTMAFGVQAAVDAEGPHRQGHHRRDRRDPAGEKQIADGTYTATVSERPTTEGAAGVQTALWRLDGKSVPAGSTCRQLRRQEHRRGQHRRDAVSGTPARDE